MDSYNVLFSNMRNSLLQMSQETEKYSLVFKREDFFTFSDSQKRNKLYKDEYIGFIGKLNALYTSFEQYTLKISSLLLESDRTADEERITLLNAVFTKSLALEKELYIFTSKTEQELAKTVSSVSVMSECASRFLLILKTFCDFLIQD